MGVNRESLKRAGLALTAGGLTLGLAQLLPNEAPPPSPKTAKTEASEPRLSALNASDSRRRVELCFFSALKLRSQIATYEARLSEKETALRAAVEAKGALQPVDRAQASERARLSNVNPQLGQRAEATGKSSSCSGLGNSDEAKALAVLSDPMKGMSRRLESARRGSSEGDEALREELIRDLRELDATLIPVGGSMLSKLSQPLGSGHEQARFFGLSAMFADMSQAAREAAYSVAISTKAETSKAQLDELRAAQEKPLPSRIHLEPEQCLRLSEKMILANRTAQPAAAESPRLEQTRQEGP